MDWYPWGEEAFRKARDEEKPIFLSIGYSTCHWCHVMERESFENPDIASLMNGLFVCIKVDREERPDVDRLYMAALQAMGQQGGWPMSLFLTPDLKPFYGGTYFPPTSAYGRAGFPDVLRRIHEIWRRDRDQVSSSGESILTYLRELAGAGGSPAPAGTETSRRCLEQFQKTYDAREGGFGGAPKFPRPAVLHFLSRMYRRTGERTALDMLEHTLRAMAGGGINDQIGGGFHRYSVDAGWRVPHFEKMLYDQAQLARCYVDAWQLTGTRAYAQVVIDILGYVLRDLRTAGGGFASAEDADSPRPEDPDEEGEGAFYLWTRAELDEILGNDGPLVALHYGVEADGNAPFDPHQEFLGRNILYRPHPVEETARILRMDRDEVERRLAAARGILFERRSRRPRPLRDDKILTSWNGLMIGALARAASALGSREYLESAEGAASFLLTHLWSADRGVLKRRYRDGEAAHEAHLDDYAFLTGGLLDLYAASGSVRWLDDAVTLTRRQLALFWDETRGGFYDTSGEDTSVLVRMREYYDGAEPSGNASAADNLLRLAALTGSDSWKQRAARVLDAAGPWLEQQPAIMPTMVSVLHALDLPPSQLVIAGEPGAESTRALQGEASRHFLPDTAIIHATEQRREELERHVPAASRFLPGPDGEALAYFCHDFVCRLPVPDPAGLRTLLEQAR